MNFDFLKDKTDFRRMYAFCNDAEGYVSSRPDFSAISGRKA